MAIRALVASAIMALAIRALMVSAIRALMALAIRPLMASAIRALMALAIRDLMASVLGALAMLQRGVNTMSRHSIARCLDFALPCRSTIGAAGRWAALVVLRGNFGRLLKRYWH